MSKKHTKGALLQRSLLRSILPFVNGNEQWTTPLRWLGRVIAVVHNTRERNYPKQKKPKCVGCGIPYENYLLYVLHLEIIHRYTIRVNTYEFSQDIVTIFYHEQQPISTPNKNTLNPNQYFYGNNYQEKMKDFLKNLFTRFMKKDQKKRRQYFHSSDVFREIGPNSEDENSDNEMTNLERELERMRICDFTDVNQGDKQFFLKWNNIIYETKKNNGIVGHDEIVDALRQFAIVGKRQNIKRINMVMHGWTLWSAGKIQAEEVNHFLSIYDETQVL